jgi:histidine triad (HIT) family protein
MENCIFCKIASGKIPAKKIIENENFFVIEDIKPKTKGHCLVIPKNHFETFLEIPPALAEDLFDILQQAIAQTIKEHKADGYNLVMNNHPISGQVIPHAHIHIIPRYKDDKFSVGI